MQFVTRFLLTLLAVACFAFADGITPAALSANGAVTRDRHLSEIGEIMRGGRGGYIDLGFYYLPSPHQTPLLSDYGEHDGFAFNHHFAGFGAGEVAKGRHLGALLWYDRSGWDGEDFFFFVLKIYVDNCIYTCHTVYSVYTQFKQRCTNGYYFKQFI